MTFISSTTVMPDLVGRLTDSEIAVGLFSTVKHLTTTISRQVFIFQNYN